MTKKLTEAQRRLLAHVYHAKNGFYPNACEGPIVGGMIRRKWMFWNMHRQLRLTPAGEQAIREHNIEV